VSLAADKSSPHAGLTAITFTATASGVTEPLFKWFISDGTAWTANGGWTSSRTFTWTPAVANANYRIRVWVKSSASMVDQAEASAEQGFAITPPAPPPARPASSVALATDKGEPQAVDTTISFAAAPASGTAHTSMSGSWRLLNKRRDYGTARF
jgi:hypothetical protein